MLIKKKASVNASTPAKVEMIVDLKSLRFVTNFTIQVPTGKNNIQEVIENVDKEIMTARNQILNQIGNKLGVIVKFDN